MKKTINIREVIRKTGKFGDYLIVTLFNGTTYKCFEKDCFEDLLEAEGGDATVEMENNKGYWNITKVYNIAESLQTEEKPEVKQDVHVATKDTSFYTAYAKDIFLGLISADKDLKPTKEYMSEAIDLVKQAKQAFS